MTDLNELLERVRSATGPDRHLDALIEVEARRQQAYRAGLNDQQRAYWNATVDGLVYDSATRYDAPRLTASIDAALALVERLLPDHGPNMVYSYDLNWHASAHAHMSYAAELFVAEGDPCEMVSYHGQAHTLPLAILAALLSALISKEFQS